MIAKAYIEQFQPHVPDEEGDALVAVFSAQEITVERFTAKNLQRRRLNLSPRTLVAGSVSSVRSALKQISPDLVPVPNDYPESLKDFRLRRIWRTTLTRVYQQNRGCKTLLQQVQGLRLDCAARRI